MSFSINPAWDRYELYCEGMAGVGGAEDPGQAHGQAGETTQLSLLTLQASQQALRGEGVRNVWAYPNAGLWIWIRIHFSSWIRIQEEK